MNKQIRNHGRDNQRSIKTKKDRKALIEKKHNNNNNIFKFTRTERYTPPPLYSRVKIP